MKNPNSKLRITFFTVIIVMGLLLSFNLAYAQEQSEPADGMPGEQKLILDENNEVREYKTKFYIGKVIEITEDVQKETAGNKIKFQQLKVQISKGVDKGKVLDVQDDYSYQPEMKVKVGEKIIVNSAYSSNGDRWFIADRYRLTPTVFVTLIFFALAIFFAKTKGLGALFGLAVSLLILIKFTIPMILDGANPLLISLASAVFIAVLSIYLAHGFSRHTSIAFLATFITLGFALGLAFLYVALSKLTGIGSETAFYLQTDSAGNAINLRGLLLGGIIIGTLGVLDDVTTTQVAAVDEIAKANPKFSRGKLYQSGLRIGKEHIASLVNTLVLAYVGASFPLMIMIAKNFSTNLWVTLNNEAIVEELIRTLVGSSALILAVPISTYLAAVMLKKKLSYE